MLEVKDIIREVESLPVEKRIFIVDVLLKSLNPPDAEIEEAWLLVAKRRLLELRSGKVKPIPGEEVFGKIRDRFDL